MYLPKRSSMAWIGTPVPSDQVLAQSKWPTVKDLYEHRLLMSAHDCFFFKLFTRSYYEAVLQNVSATITCKGN